MTTKRGQRVSVSPIHQVEQLESRRMLSATITAYVFLDFNANGTYEAAGVEPDALAQNYRIYIDQNANDTFDDGEPDFFTDANGMVTIGDLTANTEYRIGVAPRDVEGTSNDAVRSVTTGADGSTVSAGSYGIERGKITGRVFRDDNVNGSYDLGEGLGSVRVFLDNNNNGVFDGNDEQTWTTASQLPNGDPNPNGGNYRFNFIDAGTQRVRVFPAHFQIAAGTNPIVVNLGIAQTVADQDFKLVDKSAIGGVIFNDTNGDGVRQGAEALRANVRIYADLNSNSAFDVGEPSALSEAALNLQNVNYHIDAVNPGNYTVRVVKPVGITSTTPASRDVALVAGQETFFTSFGLVGGNVVQPATNDFNADGKQDIIVTVNDVSTVWYMNGTTRIGTANLPALGAGFTLAAYGDFNGDGKPDVLAHNETTGVPKIVTLNGVTKTGEILLPASNTAYKPVGVGDFDADGDLDIVWRNETTGQNTTWRMNGTTLSSFKALPSTGDTRWFIAGTGDFDQDGDQDLVWRNSATGKNTLWLLDANPIPQFRALPSTADQAWRPVAITAFNADSVPDILWINSNTSKTSVWFMPSGAGQQPTFSQVTIQA